MANNPNDKGYEEAFKLIASSGNAKSQAMMAIAEARDGNFEEAQKLLVAADEDLHSAHRAQTQLLTQEARGNKIEVNIILVHAQDHLTGAMLVRDLAEEFIALYSRLDAKD